MQLRIKDVAERQDLTLSRLYHLVNTARRASGESEDLALVTMRRYWHSTKNGSVNGPPLDIVSLSFLYVVADVLGVDACEILPARA
jgi:hypothetical protein